jgi:hypothetical protein
MVDNFLVVLFKNKIKRKIINKFITRNKAEKFYKKLIDESENVIFEKKYENGVKCSYEIALLDQNKTDEVKYYRDEIGRQIKLELEDDKYSISKIDKYRVEELILDFKTKKKITTQQLIKKYLNGSGIKMISKLNNKIVIQNDSEYNLFTLKTVEDSDRFMDCLSKHFRKIKKGDCIMVKDVSTVHRKYLYTILVEQGFPKRYLTRLATTHPK